MPRRFIAAFGFVAIIALLIALLAYTALLNPKASASPKELNVISRTGGDVVLTAEIIDNEIKIRLKNHHKDTITAFAISFADLKIKEDFAYSDVNFGIEPGGIFERDYPVSPAPIGSEPPPLYLLTVLLKDRTNDGDSKEAQEIKDERLGEKIQILRTLKILDREGQSRKDLKTTKSEIVASLDSGEAETRVTLNELEPAARITNKLSNALTTGLQVGRDKMLRRFEVVEQLLPQHREQGFMELQERLNKLSAKL